MLPKDDRFPNGLRMPQDNKPGKGEEGRRCNVNACQQIGAFFYNSGTKKYYCVHCALDIEKHNPGIFPGLKEKIKDIYGKGLK